MLRLGADLLVNGDLTFLRTLLGFKLLLAHGDAGFLFHAAAVAAGFLDTLAQAFACFLYAFTEASTRFLHVAAGSFAHLGGSAGHVGFPGIPGFALPLFLEVLASLPDDHLILADILDVVVGDHEILMEEPASLDHEVIFVDPLDHAELLAIRGIRRHTHPNVRMGLHEFFFGQHGYAP